jgi:phage baseplate assembly protein W
MDARFIGNGWAFPLRIDRGGGIALVSREREIEESIRIILNTAPGERPMRPEFGCRIWERVFGSADGATATAIVSDVRAALERWEPRIRVTDVIVSIDDTEPSLLYVDIRYTVGDVNSARNLVFPFYVIPGEPAGA